MGGMEFNKVFAALLIAGIVAMLSGFFANKLVKPEKLKENAFSVEVAEVAAGGKKVEKKAEPVLALIAQADVARGQKLSKACAACHSFDKGGANGVGPNIYGVVGKTKQAVDGFTYSGALNANGENVWTYAALNEFLWKPKKYAPGTKMNYAGIRKPEDRASLIAWLRTMADSEKPLPSEADIAAEAANLLPEVPEVVEGAAETAKEAAKEL